MELTTLLKGEFGRITLQPGKIEIKIEFFNLFIQFYYSFNNR
jgi:hypothetical protein